MTTKTDQTYSDTDAPFLDRQWFDLRPERAYRLRSLHPSEFQTFGGNTHVVVKKIHAYERARRPITLLGIPPGLKELVEGDASPEHALDAVLSEIFTQTTADRAIDLRQVLRAGLGKYFK